MQVYRYRRRRRTNQPSHRTHAGVGVCVCVCRPAISPSPEPSTISGRPATLCRLKRGTARRAVLRSELARRYFHPTKLGDLIPYDRINVHQAARRAVRDSILPSPRPRSVGGCKRVRANRDQDHTGIGRNCVYVLVCLHVCLCMCVCVSKEGNRQRAVSKIETPVGFLFFF